VGVGVGGANPQVGRGLGPGLGTNVEQSAPCLESAPSSPPAVLREGEEGKEGISGASGNSGLRGALVTATTFVPIAQLEALTVQVLCVRAASIAFVSAERISLAKLLGGALAHRKEGGAHEASVAFEGRSLATAIQWLARKVVWFDLLQPLGVELYAGADPSNASIELAVLPQLIQVGVCKDK
ncbi:hypothetical protein T492DRAFT_906349, partial [Pavlovales sp. CCMP2436]